MITDAIRLFIESVPTSDCTCSETYLEVYNRHAIDCAFSSSDLAASGAVEAPASGAASVTDTGSWL